LKHHFIDNESHIHSPIRSLNPKTKIVTLIGVVLIIVTTPVVEMGIISLFSLYFVIALAMILVSNVPISFFIRRLIIVLPFILVAVIAAPFVHGDVVIASIPLGFTTLNISQKGVLIVINVFSKSILSILFLSFLISTTPFSDLILGLKELRLPYFLSDALSIMYQYLFILTDEAEKITRARDARLYGGRWIWHANTIGYMIGAIFVRSIERGERTFLSMKARGYDTRFINRKTDKLKANDYFFGIIVLFASIAIRAYGIWAA
jgi:cobalt/nickel transport system permease protein